MTCKPAALTSSAAIRWRIGLPRRSDGRRLHAAGRDLVRLARRADRCSLSQRSGAGHSGRFRVHVVGRGSRGAYPYLSGPLTDAKGQGVVETAYLGVPPSDGAADPTGQSRIAGLVWDALIVRQDFPLASEAVFGSLAHRCVMHNAGGFYRPAGSLWIATRAVS